MLVFRRDLSFSLMHVVRHPLSVRLPLFDEIFAGKYQPILPLDENVMIASSIMDEDKIEVVATKDTVKTSRSKKKRSANREETSDEKGLELNIISEISLINI